MLPVPPPVTRATMPFTEKRLPTLIGVAVDMSSTECTVLELAGTVVEVILEIG
jgi:hypothetical protein